MAARLEVGTVQYTLTDPSRPTPDFRMSLIPCDRGLSSRKGIRFMRQDPERESAFTQTRCCLVSQCPAEAGPAPETSQAIK
nr:hypothetical protein CFP56_34908 [Quercus suber]